MSFQADSRGYDYVVPNDLPGHRLDRLLGQGGSAEVWLAWTTAAVPQPVAIKRVPAGAPASAVTELRTEAAVLAAVDHANLLRVLDVVDDPPGIALVLPYVSGGSVRTLLDAVGTLGPGEVVAVLAPVADALAALHRCGLAHGDLTPANILLTAEGRPVVADVGVTRLLGSSGSAPVTGTPAYLDPARVAGTGDAAAADLFALAVIAYEALTGRRPHRGPPAEAVALAAAGAHRPLTSWPSIPAAAAAAVEEALHPDPAVRPDGPVALMARVAAAVPADAIRRPVPHPPDGAPILAPGDEHRTVSLAALGAVAAGVPPARPRRRTARTLLAAAVLVGAGGSGVALGAVGRTGGRAEQTDPDRTSAAPATVSGTVRPPRPLRPCSPPTPPAGVGVLRWVDLDGDGCVEALRWDGSVLRVSSPAGTDAYRLGRSTDQVLFGDWDGNGTRTPALYRPDARSVFLLDRLPGEAGEQVTPARLEPAPSSGTAAVRHRDGHPDEVVIRP